MSMKRLKISGFRGMDTQLGNFHGDASTSPDAVNFVCEDGRLMTVGGTSQYAPELPVQGSRLIQGFFRDRETREDRRVLMAAGSGGLYALEDGAWRLIGNGYQSDEWRAVNYRSGDKEQVLLVNGCDGVVSWDGENEAQTIRPTQGGEEIAFEHLTLLYERLWGAVHVGAPDRIYWSESFAPEDWEVNYDTPDAGGGFLDVATFDGSRIRAIVAAFDDVLIFKDRSMHRLNGTYPGEFSLTQVYGSEGTLASRTIAHTADRLYFLGADGLCVYNGMSVESLSHMGDKKLEQIWKRMNRSALDRACAVIYRDVLYLSLPLDGSEENNYVVEYRLNDRSYSMVALNGVRDWLTVREGAGERLLCLIGKQIYEYGGGDTLAGTLIEAHWTSPEIMMDTLSARRTVGRIFMTVEAHAENGRPGIRLSLTSGKRTRSQEIRLENGVNLVRQRLRIRGRSFRFKLENMDGCRVELPRGLEILMEEDEDA